MKEKSEMKICISAAFLVFFLFSTLYYLQKVQTQGIFFLAFDIAFAVDMISIAMMSLAKTSEPF